MSIKIATLIGGPSSEHEVSIGTGKNILNTLDRDQYLVKPVFIDKSGKWHILDQFIDSETAWTEDHIKDLGKLEAFEGTLPRRCFVFAGIQEGESGKMRDEIHRQIEVQFPENVFGRKT